MIVTVFSVPTILHKSVTVSGTIAVGSETPTQIIFTEIDDVLNSETANLTASGYGYSVTVPNGHSYSIRVDYFHYNVQYQWQCDAPCQNSSNTSSDTSCALDYNTVYTCSHYGKLTGNCAGGQVRVNVSGDRMNFDIQCRQS